MRIHKTYILLSLLLFMPVAAMSNQETQLQNHEERITELESRLNDLESRLESGQGESAAQGLSDVDSNPLIGKWDCTNGGIRSEIFFAKSGRLLQTEPILGKAKSTRWKLLNEHTIVLGQSGSAKQLNLEFTSIHHFIAEDPSTRATWECDRLDN